MRSCPCEGPWDPPGLPLLCTVPFDSSTLLGGNIRRRRQGSSNEEESGFLGVWSSLLAEDQAQREADKRPIFSRGPAETAGGWGRSQPPVSPHLLRLQLHIQGTSVQADDPGVLPILFCCIAKNVLNTDISDADETNRAVSPSVHVAQRCPCSAAVLSSCMCSRGSSFEANAGPPPAAPLSISGRFSKTAGLNWGHLCPPGGIQLHLETFLVVTTGEGGVPGISWVGVGVVAKYPSVHGTAPQQRLIPPKHWGDCSE